MYKSVKRGFSPSFRFLDKIYIHYLDMNVLISNSEKCGRGKNVVAIKRVIVFHPEEI